MTSGRGLLEEHRMMQAGQVLYAVEPEVEPCVFKPRLMRTYCTLLAMYNPIVYTSTVHVNIAWVCRSERPSLPFPHRLAIAGTESQVSIFRKRATSITNLAEMASLSGIHRYDDWTRWDHFLSVTLCVKHGGGR